MAIFNKLKKTKEKKPQEKDGAKKQPVLKDAKKPKTENNTSEKKTKKNLKDLSGASAQQLVRPHITEKGNFLAENGWYVFEVWDRSSKIEIKKAVQNLYKVKVKSVNICKTAPKKRRLGRIEGIKKGTKKAMVKLQKGQSLDIFSV